MGEARKEGNISTGLVQHRSARETFEVQCSSGLEVL